jgi:hypothetical protein
VSDGIYIIIYATSGIKKCYVFVDRVPTDIIYAPDFSAGILIV